MKIIDHPDDAFTVLDMITAHDDRLSVMYYPTREEPTSMALTVETRRQRLGVERNHDYTTVELTPEESSTLAKVLRP